jgi:myosin-light-chain kinase
MTDLSVVKNLLPKKFKIFRELINGTYGRIDVAENEDNGSYYAVKTIPNHKFFEMEKILLECRTFVHPNIVRGISYNKNSQFHQLIFEYSHGGDLFEYNQRHYLSINELIPVIGQIVKALIFFHSHKIIHGDVKSENVLIHNYTPTHVKLADFGLACGIPYPDRKYRGTYEFMSPEMIEITSRKNISFSTDMWSFGVMVYELVYNELPFGSRESSSKETLKKLIRKAKFSFPNNQCPTVNDFISRLIVHEPRARMSAEQCLEHPFLKRWYREDYLKEVIMKRSYKCFSLS